MAKSVSFETMKSFILGLPATLFSNGKLCFYIEAKGDKNKFYVIFKDDSNDIFNVNMTTYASEPAFMINDLNKIFKAKHSDIMLRGHQIISYDDLVSYDLNENEVVAAIFKGFRTRFNNSLKQYYYGSDAKACFVAHLKSSISVKKMTPEFKSFDELIIWVELNRI